MRNELKEKEKKESPRKKVAWILELVRSGFKFLTLLLRII